MISDSNHGGKVSTSLSLSLVKGDFAFVGKGGEAAAFFEKPHQFSIGILGNHGDCGYRHGGRLFSMLKHDRPYAVDT